MPIRPENMAKYPGGSIRSPEWQAIRERIRTRAEGGATLRIIRIVCTVAHVDGGLDDHSDDNLRFWCQRCHNRHDAKSRQEHATITRHEKAGQLDLIGRQ